MSERTFFTGHIVLKTSYVDHIIEGDQIVRKITKYNEKPNKTWNISVVLIIIKT